MGLTFDRNPDGTQMMMRLGRWVAMEKTGAAVTREINLRLGLWRA